MRQGEELLDTVYRTVRCTYLSDLREEPYLEAAIGYLSGVEPEDYPLYQWQDAVRYLTGVSLSFETPEAVREFFAGLAEGEWAPCLP